MSQTPPRISLPRKPHYTTLTADCDFFSLFKKIERRYDNCFYLESLGEDSHIARHSIIGFDPEKLLYANGNTLTIEERDGSKVDVAVKIDDIEHCVRRSPAASFRA